MNYQSTRNKGVSISSAEAIARGISADGGLFVPEQFPQITMAQLEEWGKLDYIGRAKAVLSLFLSDYSQQELDDCVKGAYQGTFENNTPAPLASLSEGVSVLELWHGPTCAFKDMALQLLPHLLTRAARKTSSAAITVILVATSGDTGKAALEGFKDVEDTQILVFYPRDGVSDMQKLQMTTQEGGNVAVCAVEGNFDDAQTGVKRIFTDTAMAQRLAAGDMAFSSANSINWGRLVPQIVYYISAYVDLARQGTIRLGEAVNVVVPTGNFGNILAGYYAKQMGLPVRRFVCASNANRVLTDFIRTGAYDRNREFHTTLSPSMDILISSNLERLLFDLTGRDDRQISQWMEELKTTGRYEVGDEIRAKIQGLFYGATVDDEGTKAVIERTFRQQGYLCDTHTAVALGAYEQYRQETGDATPCIVVSTASPYKFASSVLAALEPVEDGADDFALVRRLSEVTGTRIPAPLSALQGKEVRFEESCAPDAMETIVLEKLDLA